MFVLKSKYELLKEKYLRSELELRKKTDRIHSLEKENNVLNILESEDYSLTEHSQKELKKVTRIRLIYEKEKREE